MTTPLMVKGVYLMIKNRGYGFVLKDYRYKNKNMGYAVLVRGAPFWFNIFGSDTTPNWIGSDTLVEWNDEETC